MPHANIWIRKEQVEQWQAIDDKSKFVSDALVLAAQYKDAKLPIQGFWSTGLPEKAKPLQRNARMTSLAERAAGKGESVELPSTIERSDHCPHGYNLRVMKCKRGCKK